MHPRLSWMPSVGGVELLVCQLGVSSPCDNQTWNWRGKDHYHLEENGAVEINCDFSEPAKHIQLQSHCWHPWVGPKCAAPEVWFGSLVL